MAEVLSKTGTAPMTATYGGTIPFTMYVYDIEGFAKADFFDATSGTDTGRRLGKTDLANGSLTLLGFMAIGSGITLAGTVSETTSTGSAITLNFGTATGSGGGGSGHSLVLYGLLDETRFKASKTPGFVACSVTFRLCGTQP